jgi:hypothetical protein
MLKHTRKRAELAAARAPLSRLVRLLGDTSLAWCCDDALHPFSGPDARRHAATLEAYAAARKGSRAGNSARAALREAERSSAALGGGGAALSVLAAADAAADDAGAAVADAAEAEAFQPPWGPDSDSEAEEAEAAAEAAAAAAAAGTASAAATVAAALEKTVIVGLTPDWITDACCDIFGLVRPCVAHPVVKGLLDPCSNNKRKPNLPAERLFDKADDGLALRNSWEGSFVLLNPPYESALQWRFINRAIDEVEWGRCRGVLLVCRNSTDTSYFQRLRPYPRALLRRDAIRFKDYPSGTPIACASRTHARTHARALAVCCAMRAHETHRLTRMLLHSQSASACFAWCGARKRRRTRTLASSTRSLTKGK